MYCRGIAVLILTLLFLSASAQEWDRVPRWADVFLRGSQGFSDLDYKLGFLMDNYDVISLEKCLDNPDNDWNTEAVFVDLVSRMRTLRPESEAKILFYWHLTQVIDCYDATEDIMSREDLWLHDNQGYPIFNKNKPILDFIKPEAREMWKSVPLAVLQATGGWANGVFVDGTHYMKLANCAFNTCGENGNSCCHYSEDRERIFNEKMVQAIQELREQLSPSDMVIGNGLQNYDFNHGDGNPTYDIFVDALDGFCMEHVMAFEGVNSQAEEEPFINIDALLNSIELRNLLVSEGKYLLTRSYPGPVGQTIDSVGGYSCPSLPANYPYKEPSTNKEMQQAMRDLYKFPLAVYLCAFADDEGKVMYTYSSWYSIGQSVPCPQDLDSCQFPDNFTEYLGLSPGLPLSESSWEGRVCSREFQRISVTVDLMDDTSAQIIVKQERPSVDIIPRT